MSYFYIIFIITLLIFTKYNFKVKTFLLSIIAYILILSNTFFNVEFYILSGTTLSLMFTYIFYEKKSPVQSIIEISTTLIFKVVEFTLIIYPETYIHFIKDFYFHLDGMFIGSILFILFSREVGYHPFKMDMENLRKYVLVTIVSYLTIIFIL